MNKALVAVSIAALAAYAALEAACLALGLPTISNRLQEFTAANPQITILAGIVVGWLAAHFTSPPPEDR